MLRLFLFVIILSVFRDLTGQNLTQVLPRSYTARFARKAPEIDGIVKAREWNRVQWSDRFADIEGDPKPMPAYDTRMKMMWDEQFLYVLLQMQEPDLWATLTQHDDIVYRDHDVEVFIDPNGDTFRYIEIEINAFGTVMDLYMDRPYKKKGIAQMEWHARGLKKAVGIQGSLNDGSDTDTGWTVEMAIPFDMIEEVTGDAPPVPGTQWRINFSRVEWLMEKEGKGYRKKLQNDGKALPEQNWVWSPQGVIDMHVPEKWGVVRFRR